MSRRPDVAARRISYRNLAIWMVYGVIAGPVGAAMVYLVRQTVEVVAGFFQASGAPLPLVALVGGVVIAVTLYKIAPDAAGEGIPSYLRAMRRDSRFSVLVTILKLPAAIITLGTMGSGGVVGPAGRAGAGIMSLVVPGDGSDPVRNERRHIAAVCGMAAAVGATFHAPLGGGIFAVEIIQRANMRYRDLFPSIIAASIAVLVMDAAGWQSLIDLSGGGAGGGMASGTLSVAAQSLRLGNGVWILLFALAIGALSGLFVRGYSAAARIFRRGHGAVWLKVAIGMGSGAAIMALISPSFAGAAGAATNALARGVVPALSFDAALPLWVAALILLVARSMAVFLTVGSGMNAGLTGPAVQAGMLAAIGAAAVVAEFSDALLLPTFLVVGFSGMLAGAMNVPIAAALLGIEVFGREFGVAAAIASVIAFQLNRGTMIYDVALADDADEAPSGPGAPDEREAPDGRGAPDTPGTANATRTPGASNASTEPPPREPPNKIR